MPPGTHKVNAFSYPWYSELRCRTATIKFLISHELTEMLDINGSWPTLPDVTKEDLMNRLQHFKKRALLLLYRLADCAAGVEAVEEVRSRQSRYLEILTVEDLAALGCIVEVFGQGFFNMTKRTLLSTSLETSLNHRPITLRNQTRLDAQPDVL